MGSNALEYFTKPLEELIDGIDNGDFYKDPIPEKYKWKHLLSLFMHVDSLDGGRELFEHLYDAVIRSAEENIRRKVQRGEKIRVYFQSYSAAQWPAESVYRRFEKEEGIETKIIISPLNDRDAQSCLDTYKQTISWFENTGHNIVGGMDTSSFQFSSWKDFGEYPDFLFQVSSWFTSMPMTQWFSELPLTCLISYIPYGIHIDDNADGSYSIAKIYNKEIVNLMWRVYVESSYELNGYKQYELLKGKNVRYSGYPKMDVLYEKKDMPEEMIRRMWKCPAGRDIREYKKILICPHYTIGNDDYLVKFSTFQDNLWFLLYIAKKYGDSISFVFKPHPNLRSKSVEKGLFASYEKYDEYIQKWNDLPNGNVVQEADYLEHFLTSDAMITDSISFLAEYLYTHKPLLLLTRPEQMFIKLGEMVTEAYYRVPGNDYSGIEEFINNVIISGNDVMKDNRLSVFKEEFDYLSINNIGASDFIANEVLKLVKDDLIR